MADGGMGLVRNLEEQNKVRILVYSHDTFGLGNIRRMLAIAEYLTEQNENFHVLVITGSPMLQGFRVSPKIDFIKLPCFSRNREGSYEVRSLPLAQTSLLKMRGRMIQCVIEDYQPDLILVDKKPGGVEGELEFALHNLTNSGAQRPALALVLRDILDDPAATFDIWQKRRYHQTIDEFYDLILVAGQPDIFDVADQYQFPATSRKKIRYCGYIQRQEVKRQKANANDKQKVLIMAGGGGDGFELMKNYLIGLKTDAINSTQETLMISGPEMCADEQAILQQLAKVCSGVTITEFCATLQKEIERADLIVCMCGYNTICEVLASGKRVVAVPRIAPVLEQYIRADSFAQRGLLTLVDPRSLNPETLMAAVNSALASTSPLHEGQALDFMGLPRMAHWVKTLVEQRSPQHSLTGMTQFSEVKYAG